MKFEKRVARLGENFYDTKTDYECRQKADGILTSGLSYVDMWKEIKKLERKISSAKVKQCKILMDVLLDELMSSCNEESDFSEVRLVLNRTRHFREAKVVKYSNGFGIKASLDMGNRWADVLVAMTIPDKKVQITNLDEVIKQIRGQEEKNVNFTMKRLAWKKYKADDVKDINSYTDNKSCIAAVLSTTGKGERYLKGTVRVYGMDKEYTVDYDTADMGMDSWIYNAEIECVTKTKTGCDVVLRGKGDDDSRSMYDDNPYDYFYKVIKISKGEVKETEWMYDDIYYQKVRTKEL